MLYINLYLTMKQNLWLHSTLDFFSQWDSKHPGPSDIHNLQYWISRTKVMFQHHLTQNTATSTILHQCTFTITTWRQYTYRENLITKLSKFCFAIKTIKSFANKNIVKPLYFAYLHSFQNMLFYSGKTLQTLKNF
jgi:hypothetical protein